MCHEEEEDQRSQGEPDCDNEDFGDSFGAMDAYNTGVRKEFRRAETRNEDAAMDKSNRPTSCITSFS